MSGTVQKEDRKTDDNKSSPATQNGHGQSPHERVADDILEGMDDIEVADLPNMLIVTNVNAGVFENMETKFEFESEFLQFDADANFQYLRSFQRVRVVFKSAHEAIDAKFHLHDKEICKSKVKCFFARPAIASEMAHLAVPALQKQFLISPPASPPVGWEQEPEARPAVNYDLLAALTNMAPGAQHELHPPIGEIPSIVVDVCDDPEGYKFGRGAIHTPRPPTRNEEEEPGTSS